MSVLAIEDRVDGLNTLKKAAEKCAFPSAHALRMFLKRRPGLVTERYRRVGRSHERLITDSEIERIQELVSRVNPPSQ